MKERLKKEFMESFFITRDGSKVTVSNWIIGFVNDCRSNDLFSKYGKVEDMALKKEEKILEPYLLDLWDYFEKRFEED